MAILHDIWSLGRLMRDWIHSSYDPAGYDYKMADEAVKLYTKAYGDTSGVTIICMQKDWYFGEYGDTFVWQILIGYDPDILPEGVRHLDIGHDMVGVLIYPVGKYPVIPLDGASLRNHSSRFLQRFLH